MSDKSIALKIDKLGLCVGCGICTALYGGGRDKMVSEGDGFLHPSIDSFDVKVEKDIEFICPGINLIGQNEDSYFKSLWGEYESIEEGYSSDSNVREKSSSGGCISTIAIYLLDKGLVDGVLHVGGDKNDYQANRLKISKSKNEVISNSSSRYAPALVFDQILNILEGNSETYCFIGKPCDVATLKRFELRYPQFSERVKYSISILCAGIPSINATRKAIETFDPEMPISDLVYRGDGWPGFFSFFDDKGEKFKMSYNDSWGKILGRDLCLRCKLCPDGIGLLADFAIGDSWETKDGYPDFTEREGLSLVICRNKKAKNLFEEIKTHTYIKSSTLSIAKIGSIQPYQEYRRRNSVIRVFAFFILRGKLLNLTKLVSYYHVPFNHPIKVLREFAGSLLRMRRKVSKKRP